MNGMTFEIEVDELHLFSPRCVWIKFALNCINVPYIPSKKVDRNQNIRYEIVPLSEMDICME